MEAKTSSMREIEIEGKRKAKGGREGVRGERGEETRIGEKKKQKQGEKKNGKEEENRRKKKKKEKEERERKEEKEGCRAMSRLGRKEPGTALQEVGFLLLRFISRLGAV